MGPSIYSDPTGYRWLGLGEEPKVLKVFGSFGMAACRNGSGTYGMLRKMLFPFFTFRGYRAI